MPLPPDILETELPKIVRPIGIREGFERACDTIVHKQQKTQRPLMARGFGMEITYDAASAQRLCMCPHVKRQKEARAGVVHLNEHNVSKLFVQKHRIGMIACGDRVQSAACEPLVDIPVNAWRLFWRRR